MENKEINNKDIDVLDRVKELLNKKDFYNKDKSSNNQIKGI